MKEITPGITATKNNHGNDYFNSRRPESDGLQILEVIPVKLPEVINYFVNKRHLPL
jgi:hypothetical protein